jgi:hypothetical protein
VRSNPPDRHSVRLSVDSFGSWKRRKQPGIDLEVTANKGA